MCMWVQLQTYLHLSEVTALIITGRRGRHDIFVQATWGQKKAIFTSSTLTILDAYHRCNLKYLKWGARDLCIILTKMGASRRWSEHLIWIHKARANVSSVFRLWMSLIWVYIQRQIRFSYSFHATSSYIWTLLLRSAAGADTQYVLVGCYIFSSIGEIWAIYLFCMSVICSLHSTILSACH